jgi:hypothetical protein
MRRAAASVGATLAGTAADRDAIASDRDATVTLRSAVFDDAPDLFRLAQLDSAEPLSDPILVAEVSGRLTAALSLREDRVIADPFVLTRGAVELLRARARQLSGPERSGRRRPRRVRRRRAVDALRASAPVHTK